MSQQANIPESLAICIARERTRVFAADPALAGDVRRWAGEELAAHPCRDDALLVVTELFANAVRHGSRGPGCAVAVCVRPLPRAGAYIAVTDSGGGGRPVPRDTGPESVTGRGLVIVDGLAARWGIRRDGSGWRVFAWLAPPEAAPRNRPHVEGARGPYGRGTTMNEPDARRVVTDWAGGERPMPRPFVLVGYQGPYVANDHGTAPLLVDAEGVQLASGAVYAWCHGGCCADRPRAWPSIEAAADFHGSYIVDASGAVRDPARGQESYADGR